jgi:hypothetical protein
MPSFFNEAPIQSPPGSSVTLDSLSESRAQTHTGDIRNDTWMLWKLQ